jgi:phosphoenolpyruvate---glycerone phosphotransferase subunit DhaK
VKKLINNPADVVREELEGIQSAHGDLVRVSYDPMFVTRVDAPRTGKVGLLSGGGSGHEPMHAGYVGRGMLDAACPGHVFTSPTPDQMLEASKVINGGAGILHIVKNYTGDVMNFDLAAEMLRGEGIPVETVLVDDDVAVENSLYTAGRRGVGLTVLMEKLLGAAAEEGMRLEDLRQFGEFIRASGRSMGMALTPCTVPAAGKPSFVLAEDEMEVGIGIHGEPGRRRVKLESVDEVTSVLMDPILQDLPFRAGDEVLLFVNSMGGTPLIELYIVYRKAAGIAKQHALKIVRNLIWRPAAVPGPARIHAVVELPAGQPVLAFPVDRGRLAARALADPHRRGHLAGSPPRRLNIRQPRLNPPAAIILTTAAARPTTPMKRVPADAPGCHATGSGLADDAACFVRLAVYRPLLPHVLRPGLRVPRPGGAADGMRDAGRRGAVAVLAA